MHERDANLLTVEMLMRRIDIDLDDKIKYLEFLDIITPAALETRGLTAQS